jgi:transposase
VGNPESGKNYATLMTLVSTCELNGVNPEEYLQDVLLRARHATTPDQIADLLPHNWKPLAPAA